MKVIFIGTSSFAVPALLSLIRNHQVQAVFTQSPKPAGRKMQMKLSPVHKVANYYGIPVHTPAKLRTYESYQLIKSIEAEVIVVCSYGLIIPSNILESKKYGCLNIHPSRLPKYRGAAPLQRAIIDGEKSTGICIMQMDATLDTGDVILSTDFPIIENTRYPLLSEQCAVIGALLLDKTIHNIALLPRIPQSNEGVSYAHKLTKEEGKIDWNKSAFEINCQVRGMNPWPGTFFNYNGEQIKIWAAKHVNLNHDFEPGCVIDKNLLIACKKDALQIIALQRPGGKKLLTSEFLKGFNIPQGAALNNLK
ncbi:methionyl-tRNA formyltransferase [Candidatus Phycorickettsia trachydisci]|uniref:Methionyl-tRNA formyltransferase n=1 Tax=Candidatus Phycorickettsia trachydisci TaxID=2115978 RepID=A0A2P1P7K5_9RICK|nr:methionyl-tRNA formyltransferase [Candidatus Phycorickettsia trachydisci]AVP87246.1 methionyl-tRNA formyltransferase [Candidatus Phycorickettsia trachydisci]